MKARCLGVWLFLAILHSTSATVFHPMSLEERVSRADHIFVGKVVAVRMFDKNGKEITEGGESTGPGLPNVIRLYITPDKNSVLKGDSTNLANQVVVPLSTLMHFTLGQQKWLEGKTNIFLLTGPRFEKVHPAQFFEPLSNRRQIEKLLPKVVSSP